LLIIWNHASDSAHWILHITFPSGYQVDMTVKNRLPSSLILIDTHIEPGYIGIGFHDIQPVRLQQLIAGIDLRLSQLKVRGHMALRDQKRVQSVTEKPSRMAYASSFSAMILSSGISQNRQPDSRCRYDSRIPLKPRVIPIPLHGVAGVAQRLQISQFITATLVPGHYMINLKRFFLSRDTAELTPEFGSFQHLISDGFRNITRRFPSMSEYALDSPVKVLI
jgi:hypothetical protein